MNPLEKQLSRLLQAAARARPEQPLAAPDRWQAGVVAAWRADRTDREQGLMLRRFLRQALLGATFVALAAIAFGYFTADPPGDETLLINSPLSYNVGHGHYLP